MFLVSFPDRYSRIVQYQAFSLKTSYSDLHGYMPGVTVEPGAMSQAKKEKQPPSCRSERQNDNTMVQSLAQPFTHVVFGTKFRMPMISKPIKPWLHAYIAGTLTMYQCPVLAINSVPDHIHILFQLAKNVPLFDVIEGVKKESSEWMNRQEGVHNSFTWQSGYGAFFVNSSDVEEIVRYIRNQENYHKIHTYEEEVVTFMKQYILIEDYIESFF